MAIEIFLGEPPANIKQWIIEHAAPASHADTRFTLADGTVKSHNITGTLDKRWFIDNGYWDSENRAWIKIITQADIGNTVISIDEWTFNLCGELTSVTIPDSVTSIGSSAFSECIDLTSLVIGSGVTSIREQAFYNCSGLTSVMIGNGVTNIEYRAFSGCNSLKGVTIPNSVTSIGEEAFSFSGLTDITIPDSITSIEEYAFNGCSALTSVTIVANGGNAANVKQAMIDAGANSVTTWNMPN